MKGITIYRFTERVTLIALDQSALPLRNQDQFGIFFFVAVEKVACIVMSQLQSVSQVPQSFSKSNRNTTLTLGFRSD